MWLSEAEERKGEFNEGGQKLQTFSYKISTRHVVYNMINVLCCMVYMKVKKVNLCSFHHKEKNIFSFFFFVFVWDDEC